MVDTTAQHLVVVPHTHWDREWYRTHEQFRHRLLRLIDELLDLLEGDPEFRHFTLDGQAIAIDDYLEVRPRARERIAKLVGAGRLLVGPWYVLPDEWLVSGEALIRNLRLGLAKAEELGGAMTVGYVPDQFGHVGQLPQLFAGFGFEGALLWRGVGSDVAHTTFWWEAPDATRLFSVYLIRGYGNAVHLPLDVASLRERLEYEASRLARRSRIGSLLLMNGSDHVGPQRGLPGALAEAARALPGVSIEIGTLPRFLRLARAESPGDLTVHRGEFRSGLRAPLLPGCASARAHQKRADFRNDRTLTRYLEPLATWLAALGGDADLDVIEHAWQLALQNHPHDSICGCSVDRVHEQMESRFQRVEEIATAHLATVTRGLAARVRVSSPGFGRGAGPSLIAWNPHAGGRSQVEGEVELDRELPRRGAAPPLLHLRSTAGKRIPAHVEVVDPGATLFRGAFPAKAMAALLRGLGPEFLGEGVRELRWRTRGSRLEVELRLGREGAEREEFEAAKERLARLLREAPEREVAIEARRAPRVRLRFVDDLPGHGLRVYRVARGRAARDANGMGLRAERLAGGAAAIESDRWRVHAAADGAIELLDRQTGTRIPAALTIASEADRGDTYNFDPVPGAQRVERPSRARVRLGPCSDAEVTLRVDARYRVPRSLAPDRRSRSRRRVDLPVRLDLRLVRGLDRIDVGVEADNVARDHRLRIELRAPLAATRFEVESAFEVVERPIAPAADAFGSESPAEIPIGTCPQRSFASVDDGERCCTVANRGVAEVEAVPQPDGTTVLAFTLLRAVGWLSRSDLVLRPGPAGPPLETPGAQVPGRHRAELSLRLHPCGDPSRILEAHRFAAPALGFAGDERGAGPLADGARLLEVDDPRVVVSAIEPSRGCGPLVRIYNAAPEPRRARVRWKGANASRLEGVNLRGQPDPGLRIRSEGGGATLDLRPWQIANLRARSSEGGS